MGDVVPLGYNAVDRTLVINDPEAAQVRWLYERYLKLKAVDVLVNEVHRKGLRSKVRTNGGGSKLTRGSLYRILANPVYVGEITHGRQRYPGQHPALLDRKLWDEVQAVLTANRRKTLDGSKAGAAAMLSGLVQAADGTRLVSTHTRKGQRRYRYYASPRERHEAQRIRVPAAELETLVVDCIVARLGNREKLAADLIGSGNLPAVLRAAALAAAKLKHADAMARRELLVGLLAGVTVGDATVEIAVSAQAIHKDAGVATIVISAPALICTRKAGLTLVLDDASRNKPDPELMAILATARRWFDDLRTGRVGTLVELAQREQVERQQLERTLRCAFLTPELVRLIAKGCQPEELSAGKLRRITLPTSWSEQIEMFKAA